MQLVITFGCNTYSDFCDTSEEYLVVKNDRVNITRVVYVDNHEQNRSEYLDDILNRAVRSFKPYRSEKELSLQITTILDDLLFDSGYDRQIRPQIEGPPLEEAIT